MNDITEIYGYKLKDIPHREPIINKKSAEQFPSVWPDGTPITKVEKAANIAMFDGE